MEIKKNNISQVHSCYGCGLCSVVCAKRIIEIHLNSDGFYEPCILDASKCSNCGLCTEVCSYLHDDIALIPEHISSYGAWSNNMDVRRKCSSGGIGYELGKNFIKKGYKVCGVRYNVQKGIAEHYIATTEEELISSAGSKYIQSYTVDAFKSINRKKKYFVTGTPCQIDSFRRYIQKFKVEDNFVLMDFFCHGVPSMLLWKKYVDEAERKVGKLSYVSWRNKFTGWHDSWAMSIDGSSKNHVDSLEEHKGEIYSRVSKGDIFYQMFLEDGCLGCACYDKCKFKYDKSSADIRIGDAWGKHYAQDEDGVNAVVVFTSKGREALKECDVFIEEQPLDLIAEGQMHKCPIRPYYHKMTMSMLRMDSLSLSSLFKYRAIACAIRNKVCRMFYKN